MKKLKIDPNSISLAGYVTFSIKLLILFTAIILILSILNIAVPETLITCFFSAFGGEFLVCGLIKVFKIREKDAESVIQPDSISAIGYLSNLAEDEEGEDE